MSVDTEKLRRAGASIGAFLKPEYGRELRMAANLIDALAARLLELKTALHPFAAESKQWRPDFPDKHIPIITARLGGFSGPAKYSVGDLRRAAALLAKGE